MDKDMNKEKLYKFLFYMECTIVSLILIFIIFYVLITRKKPVLLNQYTSPDGSYNVTLYENGSNQSLGTNSIKVNYGEKNNNTTFITNISNGGSKISDKNYTIKWNNNIAILTFHGSEQNDITYVLSFTK